MNTINYNDLTPAQALELLKEGNRRFVNDELIDYPLKEQVEETAAGQKPFAVILSCMDSRASVELVFNKGIGHLFSVRIAGNVVSEYVLASLEYAVAAVGSKLIVVMGHSDCGAIKGACDEVKMGNLTTLLAKVRWAVTHEESVKENRNSQNKEFVDKVAKLNVHHSIDEILYRSTIIKEMYDEGKIDIVPAFYNVNTGEVMFEDIINA